MGFYTSNNQTCNIINTFKPCKNHFFFFISAAFFSVFMRHLRVSSFKLLSLSVLISASQTTLNPGMDTLSLLHIYIYFFPRCLISLCFPSMFYLGFSNLLFHIIFLILCSVYSAFYCAQSWFSFLLLHSFLISANTLCKSAFMSALLFVEMPALVL